MTSDSRGGHPSIREMVDHPAVAGFMPPDRPWIDVDPIAIYAAWMLRDCPPICAPPLPTRRNSVRKFVQLARLLQFPTLMPHQIWVLAGLTELADDHETRLKHPTAVITIPRQSGKSVLSAMAAIERLIARSVAQDLLWTAQTVDDAVKFWGRAPARWMQESGVGQLVGWDQGEKSTGRTVKVAATGSAMSIVSSIATTAGHGSTNDCIVIDEAFAIVDDRVEVGQVPTLTTRYIAGAQMLILSTAGDDSSQFLRGYVDAGRRAFTRNIPSGVALWEWGAGEDLSIDWTDPRVWRQSMPALGYTIPLTVITDMVGKGEAFFRRSYLNQWIERYSEPFISPAAWRDIEIMDVSKLADKPWLGDGIWLGVDASPDRQYATIIGADSQKRCELLRNGAGVTWIAPYLAEISRREPEIRGIVFVANGPVGGLEDDLAALGPDDGLRPGTKIEKAPEGLLAQASARLYDAVMDRDIAVLASGGILGRAVASTRRRPVGSGGERGWTIARRDPSCDASPVVACALAHSWATIKLVRPSAIISLIE